MCFDHCAGHDGQPESVHDRLAREAHRVLTVSADAGVTDWNVVAHAIAVNQVPVVERIADERAAEAMDQAMLEDRTTVAKLSPVERLTCFLVKGEDLVVRAAALRGQEVR